MRDGDPPGGTSLRRVRADFSRSRRTGCESETSLSVSQNQSENSEMLYFLYLGDRPVRSAYCNDVGRISRLDYKIWRAKTSAMRALSCNWCHAASCRAALACVSKYTRTHAYESQKMGQVYERNNARLERLIKVAFLRVGNEVSLVENLININKLIALSC